MTTETNEIKRPLSPIKKPLVWRNLLAKMAPNWVFWLFS